MTLQQATQHLEKELSALYDGREARNIAALVMEHLTGKGRVDRLLNRSHELSPEQASLLQGYLSQLLQHRPVQYVLGEAWFHGLRFEVDDNVLIPRPETEELVSWLADDVKESGKTPVLLDVGTGSGCIPVALKKELPAAGVHACDISAPALAVASRNAAAQGVSIDFVLCDFLDERQWPLLPPVDMLISNPPYIPEPEQSGMAPHVVGYEPHGALFVPERDPLLFYRAIARFLRSRPAISTAYVEIHEAMAASLLALFREHGFSDVRCRRDLQNRDRMIKITRG